MNALKIGSIVLTILGGVAGISSELINKKLQNDKIKEEVAKQIANFVVKN